MKDVPLRRSQPIPTQHLLILLDKEVGPDGDKSRILFTAKQKDELWERWKNGQSVLAMRSDWQPWLERSRRSRAVRAGSARGAAGDPQRLRRVQRHRCPGGGQPCRSPISIGRLAATRKERASCVRRPRHPRAAPGPARSTIKQAPVLMDTRRAWLRRGVSSRTAGQSAGNFPPRSNCSLDCSAR